MFENLEAASGDVSRVRVALEGSRAFATGSGGMFTPTLELGILTPYTGFSMAGNGDGHTYYVGARWNAEPAFGLALEGSNGNADGDASAAAAATHCASYRW